MKQQLEKDRIFNAPYALLKLEIQKYCHNEPRFNDVYPKNYLPKTKIRANVINLDK